MNSPAGSNIAEHLNASLQVIGVNATAYYSGSLHAYRPIAAELRKLLCDTQSRRDISLLPQCFPGIHLHPLLGNQSMIDEHTTLYIPAMMSFDGKGGSDIDMLFNEAGAMLPVPEWLDQRLFDHRTTIRDFIRSVADKEGAHADKEMNDALRLTKSVIFPGNETLAAKTILAVARYVVKGCGIGSVVRSERETGQIKSRAADPIRGVYVLDLRTFCHLGATAPSLDFIGETDIPSELLDEPQKIEALRMLIAAYEPAKEFLLMTIDLNGRGRSVYGIGF